ncbi:hypothetical protein [[Actinomadura] parvosata]|nr:hypothetical protein [Nonomuraea sp. ATCC 55076]
MASSPRSATATASAGWIFLTVVSLGGYALLAWSLWRLEWLTTGLTAAGVAALALPVAGALLGRAITTGRPHPGRAAAAWAGAAAGAACLLLGSLAALWSAMVGSL